MTCNFSDAQLYIPTTGDRVRVYDIQSRAAMGKMTFAQCRVHRVAGEMLDGVLFDVHPAELWVGGRRLARLAVDTDAVQLGSVDSMTATVRLSDPRVVLERGTLDILLDEATLKDTIDNYVIPIINEIDPNGVIQGVRYTDGEYEDLFTEAYTSFIKRGLNDLFPRDVTLSLPEWYESMISEEDEATTEFALGIVEGILDWSTKAHRWTYGLSNRKGGFDIEGATPAQAIRSIADEFELETWVDDDGYLWFGHSETRATPFVVGERSGDLIMNDYSVVEEKAPVTQVMVEGRYRILELSGTDVATDAFRARSHAVWSGKENGKSLFLEPKNVTSIGQLEKIAESALRQHATNSERGQITINGSVDSSLSEVSPHDVSLGDHIFVIPSERDCGPDIPASTFAVKGITHEINPTVGWELKLSVGKLVAVDSIETTTMVTSQSIDGWVSSEEFYARSNGLFSEDGFTAGEG